MEDYRDELVVIVAGYPAEMQAFLKANAGLAGRFHFTLPFASYTADEVVAIGHLPAGTDRLKVDDAAWELLRAEATQLRAIANAHSPNHMLPHAYPRRHGNQPLAQPPVT